MIFETARNLCSLIGIALPGFFLLLEHVTDNLALLDCGGWSIWWSLPIWQLNERLLILRLSSASGTL